MKSLITGVTGFVGSHLAELLLEEGQEVDGLSRNGRWPFGTEHLASKVQLRKVDCTDAEAIRSVLRERRPQHIYHLAGQANVPQSIRDPDATWRANFHASECLYKAVLKEVPETKILQVSSGNVYGQPPEEELPITERTPIRPLNPYAQSKASTDDLACRFVEERSARIVIARPFNHIGPRQQPTFAIAHFAKQIAEQTLKPGQIRLKVGQLDVQRDFTDVRDIVRAYRALMGSAEPGEIFNVASGVSRRLGDLLERLIALSQEPIELIPDPSLLRNNDPTRVTVSPETLFHRTNWQPRVEMDQTLRDTSNYWRLLIAECGIRNAE